MRLIPRDRELGWTPFAWLIFLPVFFVQPVVYHASLGMWLAYLSGALIFLGTYFRGHWLQGRGVLRLVGVQVILGAVFTPMNLGAYVFFTYAASFAGRIGGTANGLITLVAVVATGFATAYLADAPLYYWLCLGVLTPLIGAVNLHFAQVRRSNAKLRFAHDKIEQLAAVAERERIARDLHDVLGHTLTLIVLKAELAAKLAEREPGRAIQEIRDVEQASRDALHEVRAAIRGYRPTLISELESARELLTAARIRTVVAETIEPHVLRPWPGVEEVMALALREAVTNVVRHSGASRARIRAWRENEFAMLEVSDDGRGGDGGEGSGLRGMRDRVEALHGRLDSAFDNGARLTIAIPLAALGA